MRKPVRCKEKTDTKDTSKNRHLDSEVYMPTGTKTIIVRTAYLQLHWAKFAASLGTRKISIAVSPPQGTFGLGRVVNSACEPCRPPERWTIPQSAPGG